MVELKEKTVEELRKMASKKKIEGRSKMNKAQLVRALQKKSLSKKIIRKKMKGGVVVAGVDYSLDRLNWLADLTRPSTNNTQRPRLYLIDNRHREINLTNIMNRQELLTRLERTGDLVIRVDSNEVLAGISYSINVVIRRPLSGNWFSYIRVNENVFFFENGDGNYMIFDTNKELQTTYRDNLAGYQAKLIQLGLGDEQRLFPIIPPHQLGQE